ncbi:helix-turn-helix transcriptional regulator [Sporosarcina sp. FSL K6-2383]|uniref:helix-turn-helix domain-containing protein n=1 Tax=Sporosarcina sp. FSL K6-2383 TaxID=2921556 RepID=UPI00315AB43F
MVDINLPVLLAQRRMTISDLHRATGISRTTIISLYYERAKGVKFTTLSIICKYLKCEIGELIKFKEEEALDEYQNRELDGA